VCILTSLHAIRQIAQLKVDEMCVLLLLLLQHVGARGAVVSLLSLRDTFRYAEIFISQNCNGIYFWMEIKIALGVCVSSL
jgi:hypothetical protein